MSDDLDDTSWIRAYTALLAHASTLRGHFTLNPATLDVERWPHTTGADIVLIAAVVDPIACDCDQYGTANRWKRALAELDPTALRRPSETYPQNRTFWRLLASTCADLHAARAPLPSARTWSALFEQLEQLPGFRNASGTNDPPFGPFPEAHTFSDIYRAQLKLLLDLRGFDLRDAPPDHPFGGAGAKIPRTTIADVRTLVRFWNPLFAKITSTPGVPYVAAKWGPIVADVESHAGDNPTEVYAKNNELWRELPNVTSKLTETINRIEANQLDIGSEIGSFLESLKKSWNELPDRIHSVTHAVGEGAEKVAREAGKIAREAAGGMFSGLGPPILIGAAAVAGLLILSRRGGSEEHEHEHEEE